MNRPGFRGGCLVKVKPPEWLPWRIAYSSLPQLLREGCNR
ncbi:hypothetical protein SAMN05216318_1611, partial [Nitrosomonas eutropha]